MALAFDLDEAVRSICAADPALARLVERAGPCRLQVDEVSSPFLALAESIAYQQLTGKAAATIFGRVVALYGPRGPTPRRVLDTSDESLRGAGLSRAKVLALRDLAAKTLDRTVPTASLLARLDDDEIVERLTSIRGIGRWTVEMLLMFRLGRPDVLPATDYGVRKGYAIAFRKRALPAPADIMRRGERWRPYRSVASWYLWRAIDLRNGEKTGRG